MKTNTKLAEELLSTMKKKKLKLASAESMTGGLFAKTITDISGASKVFDRGLITYSNQSKIDLLEVDNDTIDELGAISSQTAREMVEGLALASKCDVCIAITGNAGPNAAEKKSVGLYYIGLRYNGITNVLEFHSDLSNRDSIRIEACNNMLQLLNDVIK